MKTFSSGLQVSYSLHVWVLGCLLATAGAASAQVNGANVPQSIPFQGFLTDLSGVPIDDILDITFKLYLDSNEIWSQTKSDVEVVNGVFNVALTNLSVPFNEAIELGITVANDPEISPRTPLLAAPYAMAMRGMHAVIDGRAGDQAINVIGGFAGNTVSSGIIGATIGGGGFLSVAGNLPHPNTVSGDYGTVSGGFDNTASSHASTVVGGQDNAASGSRSTVAGGWDNEAGGAHALAAGRRAKAMHDGTFVWADGTNADFSSSTVDQFLIRAAGGVGIGTNAPNTQLSVIGDADFADNVAIGKIAASAPLDIQGGNWDFSISEGDVRIGSSTQRLKIAIATGGGGAGIARLNAVGTVPRILLGTGNTDVVGVSPTSFAPAANNVTELGNSTNRWTEVYATNGVINTSDRRMKQNVRALSYGIDEVMHLLPLVYTWRDSPGSIERLGLIAQDVDAIIPEVVHHGDSPDDMLGLNYAELVPVLIKAIQEQQETIEAQSRRLAVLEARMTN